MGKEASTSSAISAKIETWPKVAIIVLNWNGWQDTIECLESLQQITYPNYQIIVVDNGSTDESVEVISTNFPEIKILASKENLGFSGGSNLGIKYALGNGADYVLLLNNDTVVDSNFLKPMVQVAESDNHAGIVSGKIYYYNDKERIWSTGGHINRLRGSFIDKGRGVIDRGQFDKEAQRTFFTGCTMLIKRDVFELVGLLPEAYFFGGEDLEFSLRVSKKGMKLVYCPKAVIWHKVGASHQRFTPKYVYNSYLSKILFMKRNLCKPLWFLWYFLFCVYSRTLLFPRLSRIAESEGGAILDKEKTFMALKAAILDGLGKEKITKTDLERWS